MKVIELSICLVLLVSIVHGEETMKESEILKQEEEEKEKELFRKFGL